MEQKGSLTMKPEWLKQREAEQADKDRYRNLCMDCEHFGRPVKHTRYKGKEDCLIHECDIHPGCMNTKFAVGCEDWVEML